MIPFDYIPQIHYNHFRTDIKYSLRKRVFHPGWALSYCRLPAHENYWTPLIVTDTQYEALRIIANSHRRP